MASVDAAVDIPEDLYPIAVLIDELKHDDVQCRLNSMRKLATIATALGPERTRDELIPFLEDGCDDEDEVLLVMAEQLGQFVQYVGGADFAYVLLSPLQHLAVVEETTVRDRAVASLNAVLSAMPGDHVERYGWSLTKRLGERDWFTSKTSACGILPRCYSRLPTRAVARTRPWASDAAAAVTTDSGSMMDVEGGSPKFEPGGREDALELYVRLCGVEEVPMVRRAAAAHLGAMGSAVAGGALPAPLSPEEAHAQATAKVDSAPASPHVDTGDMSAAAVPPAVPDPITVSASSPAAGGTAVTTLLPLLQSFARDEQDGVRLLAVDATVAAALLLNGGTTASGGPPGAAPPAPPVPGVPAKLSVNAVLRESVLGLFTSLGGDRSWRVRWSVANRFAEATQAFGAAIGAETLLPLFDRLTSDPEAEVRTAAAYRVSELGTLLPRDRLVAVLLPSIARLAEDVSEPVRAALAAVILGLALPLGTDTTIATLLPLFLKLLKDSSPQVRLNIISRLEAVNAVIGLKMLSAALLPAITDLSSDKAWRVRHATIAFFPSLARQLGSDVFEASPELLGLVTAWLGDSVSSIREIAIGNLKRLAEVFGPSWAERVLVPRIAAYGSRGGGGEGNYQARSTGLGGVLMLAEALPPAVVRAHILPVVFAACGDAVPNLRFAACKGLERLFRAGKLEGSASTAQVKAALAGMAGDPDADVRYYSSKALTAVAHQGEGGSV